MLKESKNWRKCLNCGKEVPNDKQVLYDGKNNVFCGLKCCEEFYRSHASESAYWKLDKKTLQKFGL